MAVLSLGIGLSRSAISPQDANKDALIESYVGGPDFLHKAQLGLVTPLAKGLDVAIESFGLVTGPPTQHGDQHITS